MSFTFVLTLLMPASVCVLHVYLAQERDHTRAAGVRYRILVGAYTMSLPHLCMRISLIFPKQGLLPGLLVHCFVCCLTYWIYIAVKNKLIMPFSVLGRASITPASQLYVSFSALHHVSVAILDVHEFANRYAGATAVRHAASGQRT